jgi:hypothetical protein
VEGLDPGAMPSGWLAAHSKKRRGSGRGRSLQEAGCNRVVRAWFLWDAEQAGSCAKQPQTPSGTSSFQPPRPLSFGFGNPAVGAHGGLGTVALFPPSNCGFLAACSTYSGCGRVLVSTADVCITTN